MSAKHLNQTQEAVIDLVLCLRPVVDVHKKLFNDPIEHAEYELDNLAIIVVDIEQPHALLKPWHNKLEQIVDNALGGALDDAVKSLHQTHDLLDAALPVDVLGLDKCQRLKSGRQRTQYRVVKVHLHVGVRVASIRLSRATHHQRSDDQLLHTRRQQQPRHLVDQRNPADRPELLIGEQ